MPEHAIIANDIQISFFFIFPSSLGNFVLYLFRRRANGFVTFFFRYFLWKGQTFIQFGPECPEFLKKQPFYLLSLFMTNFQLIECQVSSGFVSNGPKLASTCTLNFPLKLPGARHENLQVPPQPYLNLPEVRTLPASLTILKAGAGCHWPFF